MNGRGTILETRRKVRRLLLLYSRTEMVVSQTTMVALGVERSGGIRARLTKKGPQLAGLIMGVQETGGRLKGECPVLALKNNTKMGAQQQQKRRQASGH